MDKLALAHSNHEKERQLIEQTKEYIHRKTVEVNEQPKNVISDEKLRLLCLPNRYNFKPVSIVLQQCDVAKEQKKLAANEANKMDLNVSENENNKVDLNVSENESKKADLNVSENESNKVDLNVSENKSNKADLNSAEKDENKEDSTECENNVSNKRSTRPKNSLEEPDPLLKALKENSPEDVDALLQDDGKKINGSCLIAQEDVNTHDGEITIKTYGIRRSKKQKKHLKCPDSACDEVFDFVKDMNVHVAKRHPDIRFRCSFCPKSYQTYNARYKHEHKNFELPHCCHYCSMRFLFPGLRTKHEHQHTGNGLFPCT